jgi:23S rRNA (uracil-5-)-methyltransferase RumA
VVRYVRRGHIRAKDFRKLIVTNALEAAAAVEPRCPHVGMCGGCTFQDRAYADQVAAKAAALNTLWENPDPPLAVVPSPDPFAYRTRMDYVTTKGRFGLRRRGKWNYIIELETCHLIPPAAFGVVHRLWLKAQELGIPDYNVRSHEGFLRYLVVRRSPQDTLLIALVTADGGGAYDEGVETLAALALEQPGVEGVHWLINDSLTDLSFGEPRRFWGAETLPMRVGPLTLHIGPNTFFQNNVHLLDALLEAVREAVTAGEESAPAAVADLYGGVGLIALHLSPYVGRVVTVESHAESAALARRNAHLNQTANVAVVSEDVHAFGQQQPAGAFACVVADPPRTGLGGDVCAELLRMLPRRIVYVSCNPLTQREDIARLAAAYRLTTLRGYDMFPHTPHVEMLAVLERT